MALLGVAFYALLIPWHLTSQFAAQVFRAEYGVFAGTMCGSGPENPGAPTSGCPICKGLAAFQLALTPAPPAALPALIGASPHFALTRDDVAGAPLPVRRSRGPPLPA